MTRTPPKRLYVANFGCNGIPEITEFKNLNTSPYGTFAFSYNSTLIDPISVTTDSAQHVYVADFSAIRSSNCEQQQRRPQPLRDERRRGRRRRRRCRRRFRLERRDADYRIPRARGPQRLRRYAPRGGRGDGSRSAARQQRQSHRLQPRRRYKIAKPAYNAAVQIATTASFQCVHLSLNAAGNHLFISEPFKSTPDIQIIKYPGGLVLSPILPSAHLRRESRPSQVSRSNRLQKNAGGWR